MLYQIAGLKDVAFEIIKHHHFPESSKPHKLKIVWWNVVRSHPPFPMGLTQNIKLTDEQWATKTIIRSIFDECEDTRPI